MKIELSNGYQLPQQYYEVVASNSGIYIEIENPSVAQINLITQGLWNLKVDGHILENMFVETCVI